MADPHLLHRRSLMLAAVAALATLASCDNKPAANAAAPSAAPAVATSTEPFRGIDITGADYAKELSLTDPDGKRRTLAEFKGKVVVVFFGFTQCPDVCPTTMVELANVKKALGPAGNDVQGIFVSVDPERDTPELLKAYLDNFGGGFVGLRGSLDETKATAKAFKVFFGKVPGKTETSYTVDHTAGSFIFDRSGRVRLFTRYGTGSAALQSDLQRLLNETAPGAPSALPPQGGAASGPAEPAPRRLLGG